MKSLLKILGWAAAFLLGSIVLTQAATVVFVPQGGTGNSTFTSSQVLYGNGTNALSSAATSSFANGTNITVTNGATSYVIGSQPTINLSGIIAYTNGGTGTSTGGTPGHLPYFGTSAYLDVPTTTASCTGTASCTAFTILGSTPISINVPASGSSPVSTSTSETAGRVAYWTTTSGTPALLGQVATSSFANGTNITVTNGSTAFVLGSQPTINLSGIVAYANGGTGTSTGGTPGHIPYFGASSYLDVATTTASCTGTVTCSILTILGSSPVTITGSAGGNIISTTSPLSIGNLAYYTGTTPTSIGGVATSAPSFSGGLTTTGTAGAWVGGSSYAVTLANVNANSILGNKTGAAATPTSVATSSELFTGTIGQTQIFSGTNSLVATSTLFFSTGSLVGISSTTPTNLLSIGSQNLSQYGSIAVTENALATSTSMTVDWTKGNQQLIQLGGSAVTIGFTNASTTGQTLKLIVCNPRSTAGAITWNNPAVLRWAGGTAPTQTTTANKCDVWSFLVTQASSTSAASPQTIFGAQTANF